MGKISDWNMGLITNIHDCEKGFEEVKIMKLKNLHTWTMRLLKHDIDLNFLDYCPYCGVKLP